ncbi:hypothetical protein E1A91_D12G101300v1 [Gossypium mustelinum]|uniref:Uncharacterized protein n=2 Tax=Gossypium mustelinum TaxID=34275 RepID=A0A5D2SE08_GOSMU|nr:hypothetical protein E1A91_D12G101300v1 [Gossypium mustelinum]TYI50428.1 hypothetical protein E1A91_D12G101300v1 [Gossypium mustelinum]
MESSHLIFFLGTEYNSKIWNVLFICLIDRDMQCFQQHIVSIRLTQLCGESRIWSGHGEHKVATLTLHTHLEGFSSNIDKTSRPLPRSRHWKLKSQHSTLEVTTSMTVAKDESQLQGCSKVTTLRSKVAILKSLFKDSSKLPRKSQHWTCDDSTLRLDGLKICKSVSICTIKFYS